MDMANGHAAKEDDKKAHHRRAHQLHLDSVIGVIGEMKLLHSDSVSVIATISARMIIPYSTGRSCIRKESNPRFDKILPWAARWGGEGATSIVIIRISGEFSKGCINAECNPRSFPPCKRDR